MWSPRGRQQTGWASFIETASGADDRKAYGARGVGGRERYDPT
jgi:hypothetical protein